MRSSSYLPLPVLLALRAHLRRNRALSLLTLLAIAGSVMLATGLEMSSRGVEAELERTARAVAGAAQLEVVGGTLGVSEALVAEVAASPGVRLAAPLVQATFRLDAEGARDESLQVIGIDLLADPGVRTYSGAASIEDPLKLIAGVDAVVVSDTLAKRLALRAGDSLPVRTGRSSHRLTVRGTLAREGLAEAFGGQIAVMDVYALQHLLGREGWVDRIDVVLADGAAKSQVLSDLSERLRGRATVRHSGARDGWLATALQVIRAIVIVLVVVAIAVASLVSYSALSLFVDRRIPELALLRAAGLEARRVRRFLYLDTAILAVAGTTLGLTLGRAVSESFRAGLSWVTGFLQGVEVERLEVRDSTFIVALLVGGLVSFTGVLAPARRATVRAPLAALLGNDEEERATGGRSHWALLASLLVAALAVVTPGVPALARIVVVLGAGVVALDAFGRVWLPTLLPMLRRVLESLLPGVGRLGAASLVARPTQTALAVVCIAGVVAGVTMSLTIGGSAARTLDDRMTSHYPDGVVAMAGKIVAANPDEFVSHETVRVIRETPGVRAVFERGGERIVFRGEEVLLVTGNMSALARFGRLDVISGDARAIAEAVASGSVVVSESFALRFGVNEGDSVTLDTPRGPRTFRVAGRIYDFAGPAGSINIDLSVFDQLWLRRGARDLVFWTEGDPEPVIAEIRRRVGESQTLFFVHGDELAHFASGFLRQFQGILMSVALLTAFLGGIAVWNMMLAAVTTRTRELALLLSVGATARQIRLLTLVDGLLLGLLGGLAGIGFGLLAAYGLLTHFIAETVGWPLRFSVAPRDIAFIVAGIAVASLAASLYPAWLAGRVPMREAASAE